MPGCMLYEYAFFILFKNARLGNEMSPSWLQLSLELSGREVKIEDVSKFLG